MPPKPWAASFKVNKDTGGAEGNVFWGSTCWWMIVVLQHSPSQAPRCQLPWQVCLSFLLAVQNLPMPARCSVCKALNSRKPVLSLTPHRAIHPCKLNPQKCSWNTTKCVLLLCDQCGWTALHQLQYHLQYQSWAPGHQTHQWFNFHNHTTLWKLH